MDKKKIGIIGLSVAGLLALVLIFNGIFLNAKNDKNTENNKTTVSNSKENENKQDKEDNNKQEDKENKKDEQNNQVNNESTTTENNKETNVNEIKNDKESSKNPTTSKPSTNNNSNTNNTTQEVKPQNQNTQPPKAQTVSISIDCKTAIANGLNNKKGFTHLPSSGVILSNMIVEIKDGDTVFDVLVNATRQKGIHMEYTGSGPSTYIEGTDNLYEFDAGSESGWKYTVNGKNVNYGCGEYKVKANDVIKFSYTCNLGKDLGDK